jgi:hypothetical protein
LTEKPRASNSTVIELSRERVLIETKLWRRCGETKTLLRDSGLEMEGKAAEPMCVIGRLASLPMMMRDLVEVGDNEDRLPGKAAM